MRDRPIIPLQYASPDPKAHQQAIGLMIGTIFGIVLGAAVMALFGLYLWNIFTGMWI